MMPVTALRTRTCKNGNIENSKTVLQWDLVANSVAVQKMNNGMCNILLHCHDCFPNWVRGMAKYTKTSYEKNETKHDNTLLKPNLKKYFLFRTLLFKPVVLWSNATLVSPRKWSGKHCYMMLALHSSAKHISIYSKFEWKRFTSLHVWFLYKRESTSNFSSKKYSSHPEDHEDGVWISKGDNRTFS